MLPGGGAGADRDGSSAGGRHARRRAAGRRVPPARTPRGAARQSAIRAGAETLLQLQHKTAADITKLVIAGGFGSFMDKHSALHIGLLPQVPPEKISHVGNAAGAGAINALLPAGETALAAFTKKCGIWSSPPRGVQRELPGYMAFDED
jgi:hypothetical protein